MQRTLLSLAFVALLPVSSPAQVTTTGPFLGAHTEEFETLLSYPWPSCLPGRIFDATADCCTPLGPYCVDTYGWLLYCAIYPHNGSNGLFGSAQGPVEITFDVGAQRFGGWFGTNGYLPGGHAEFYDASNALIANVPITAPACALAWNGWDVGAGAKIGRILLFANDPYNQGGLLQMDDLEYDVATVATPFCSGDGSVAACPCGNSGAPDHGCANSAFAAGAALVASGSASVNFDTLVLQASGLTGTSAVFFQGDAEVAPVAIADGLGCVGGTILRLGTKAIAANASAYPQGTDQPIDLRGDVPGAGGTRFYQCFYRNAAASFCPPGTSNRTNGVAVVWIP